MSPPLSSTPFRNANKTTATSTPFRSNLFGIRHTSLNLSIKNKGVINPHSLEWNGLLASGKEHLTRQ